MRLAARLFNWRAASRPLAPELKAFVRFAELATPVLPGGPADELVSGEEGGPDAADEGEAAPEVATAATATDAAADDLAAAAAAAAAELPERSPSFRLLLHRLAADHRARRILARPGGASRRAA